MESTLKSRPVYPPVEKALRSLHHVFIVSGEMPDTMSAIINHCDSTQVEIIQVDDSNSKWQLATEYASALPLSCTVYLAGNEVFLWRASELLTNAGVRPDQIKMFAPTDSSRAVFCCHCYAVTEGVTHSPCSCSGCDRLLAVTDHFSQKQASYFGYQVNAEDADDIPPSQELF